MQRVVRAVRPVGIGEGPYTGRQRREEPQCGRGDDDVDVRGVPGGLFDELVDRAGGTRERIWL